MLEQVCEKLKETTISILEESVLSSNTGPCIFGQAGPLLVVKISPARPLLYQKIMVQQYHFFIQIGTATLFLPGPFFL